MAERTATYKPALEKMPAVIMPVGEGCDKLFLRNQPYDALKALTKAFPGFSIHAGSLDS